MTCEQAVLSLGAYVLEALSRDERRELDRHLGDCPVCAAELSEIDDLPDLFAQVPLAEVLALGAPTAADSRQPAGTSRPGRGRQSALGVAATLVVLTAVAVQGSSGQPPTPSYSASSGRVRMTLQVDDRPVGTRLSVRVSGVPAHEHCQLIAVARDGSRTALGGWTADYEGSARYVLVSPVPLQQLAQIVLLGERHRPLVAVAT